MEKGKNKDSFSEGHTDDRACEDDDVTQAAECGIGRFKPAALGICANMAAFSGFYSTNSLLTSTLSSYVNSQVTTLERHFGFSSAETGLIMAANDVGFLSVVLLFSYLAMKIHIPRTLAATTILFGVSGLVCALPYFMFSGPSPSNVDVTSDNVTSSRLSASFSGQMCNVINSASSDCSANVSTAGVLDDRRPVDKARANSSVALVLIVLGMVLQGIAKAPRTSLVSAYVDNNVNKTNTGFYTGIILAFTLLGPGLAFALGGLFSRIYVTLEETQLTFRHPSWIGAWWLGYVTFGIASCLFAIPVCFFPRQMKAGKPHRKPSSTRLNITSVPKMAFQFLKDWLGAMWRLITNPVYVCVLLSTSIFLFSVAGSQSFTPKYIENQFSFDVSRANFAMAGMMLTIAAMGTFLGGYLTKRFKMDAYISLKFIFVCQTISSIFVCLMMAMKCDQPLLYNSPGPLASGETTLSGCYDNCACDDGGYFPVCGDDGRMFFSPCHAGCQGNAGLGYANCSCIAGGTAVAGLCDYGCPMFYVYMVFFCLAAFFGTLIIIPTLIVFLRTSEERDKALAIGLYTFMTSVIGWMLGPICFGKLIDSVCIQWEKSCSGIGACRLYDNDDFRLAFHGFQAAARFVAFIFIFIGFVVAKLTRKTGNENDDVGEDVEVNEAFIIPGKEGGRKMDRSYEQETSQRHV